MVKKTLFNRENDKDNDTEEPKKYNGNIVKKDWVLHQNDYHKELKEGDPLPSDVPEHLLVSLKTEGVI